MAQKTRPGTVKEACIDEAFRIIETQGVENLSLREVARRLGVSHQAPYKHFATREHILSAVVARCYAEFARHLENRTRHQNDWDDLAAMGLAYLSYARKNPLKYRLMFNSALPHPEDHPDMMINAKHAFSVLYEKLSHMYLRDAAVAVDDAPKHDAVFIWSTLHGLASLMESDAINNLPFTGQEKEFAIARAMARLSLALEPDN